MGKYPIILYQILISPFLPPVCRFYPTCSQYALEAIKKYGLVKGIFLALMRLMKCHSFHPGGYDPIPKWNHREHREELRTLEKEIKN